MARYKKEKIFLLILLFSLSMQGGREASGQSGRQTDPSQTVPTQSGDDILRVKTEEVLLPVSVRDEMGAPVNGLEKERFIVFDNGVRQEIESFNRHRVSANIVLLLDASSSVFSESRP